MRAAGGSSTARGVAGVTARGQARPHNQCCRPRPVPGGQRWLPTLRQPRRRALGPGERSAPLPLQSLPAHLQRADEDAVGEVRMKDKWAAQTEAMIEGVQPGASRAALRCASHHGVPLAAQVSGGAIWR